MAAGQMLTVWACFLHKALSFLEKNGWPSRLVEQTCREREPKTCRAVLLFKQYSQHFHIFRSNSCCCLEWNCLVDLPHTQSRCHARWILEPPGTCPRPQWGSRSRGSWSQTGCSSLSEKYIYKMLFCLHTFCLFSLQHLIYWWGLPTVPCSQYGCPSSMWNMLPLIGCWQAAQTKQDTCQVCFRAFMTSCRENRRNKLGTACWS